jgi:hypothetical protein
MKEMKKMKGVLASRRFWRKTGFPRYGTVLQMVPIFDSAFYYPLPLRRCFAHLEHKTSLFFSLSFFFLLSFFFPWCSPKRVHFFWTYLLTSHGDNRSENFVNSLEFLLLFVNFCGSGVLLTLHTNGFGHQTNCLVASISWRKTPVQELFLPYLTVIGRHLKRICGIPYMWLILLSLTFVYFVKHFNFQNTICTKLTFSSPAWHLWTFFKLAIQMSFYDIGHF